METQWPLVIFTLFVCLTCGTLGGMSILALKGQGRNLQMTALITSAVSLVVGGIGAFLHLEHWERIFNGFGHITSGITLEFIGCIVFAVVLVLAVLGGTLIERLHLENDVEEFIRNAGRVDLESPQMSVRDRLSYAKTQVASTVRKVAPYVLVGVAIGALIHNFIPQAFVEELLGAEHWYSVPLATLIGIPMYADIFGTIPIAESLFAKGAGLGTVLSFMMGVTALSLPSMVMLRKAVKPRLLAVFFGVVVVGIMLIGFFFNAISVAF